jgi:hypothetical protein
MDINEWKPDSLVCIHHTLKQEKQKGIAAINDMVIKNNCNHRYD